MQPTQFIDELSPTRREILRALKVLGEATIPELAARLRLVHESIRKQVLDMQRRGWITSRCEAQDDSESALMTGRPPVEYCLTSAGDHFFPKDYDGLFLQMLEALKDTHGEDAVVEIAATLTDDRVARLQDRSKGSSLQDKVEELRAIYREDDAFIKVEPRGADLVVIEKCCPYLNIALEHPLICSTTVSTLRRVLGYEVVRERRFQDGDQRCEFHVKTAHRAAESSPRFEFEPSKSGE